MGCVEFLVLTKHAPPWKYGRKTCNVSRVRTQGK